MADQPGQEPKDTGQETIFNSGIGDDWGEAFEAEDFMATPKDEAHAEFFLPDEATDDTIIAIPDKGVETVAPVAASPPGRLRGLYQALAVRLQTIPLPLRLVTAALPIFALILFLTWRAKLAEQISPSPVVQEKAVVDEVQTKAPESATHPPESELPPPPSPSHSPEQLAAPESHQETPKDISPGPTPPEQKELRKKWRFPAIIVHAKTDKGHQPAILSIDLTLILRLPPAVMPPADKDSFIREILYQFYTNQPSDDLQRYALDRGEMNRKLQAWVMKQWPELQLDAIVIDRYQLL